jgi:hypothetical protein
LRSDRANTAASEPGASIGERGFPARLVSQGSIATNYFTVFLLVSIWADDETEYILPALLISGFKVKSNGRQKP